MLGDRVRDGVREIPDVDRKGKGCMGGWVGVPGGGTLWRDKVGGGQRGLGGRETQEA